MRLDRILWVGWFAVGLVCLMALIYRTVEAAEEKAVPFPLTTTERLALSSLNERNRVLQEDIRALYNEICSARSFKVEECSIDPAGMTVSRIVRTPPPASGKQ